VGSVIPKCWLWERVEVMAVESRENRRECSSEVWAKVWGNRRWFQERARIGEVRRKRRSVVYMKIVLVCTRLGRLHEAWTGGRRIAEKMTEVEKEEVWEAISGGRR